MMTKFWYEQSNQSRKICLYHVCIFTYNYIHTICIYVCFSCLSIQDILARTYSRNDFMRQINKEFIKKFKCASEERMQWIISVISEAIKE